MYPRAKPGASAENVDLKKKVISVLEKKKECEFLALEQGKGDVPLRPPCWGGREKKKALRIEEKEKREIPVR